ncbi:MAG: PadR family transcriptional regulator [Chloroflexi bacterium]|nr:PadR family transcriptional regulator [Chloroflexota bacterium]
MDTMLTNSELVIIGLVAEAPKYGYQIEQNIVQRGMREWTEIGFSSIYYLLNKLEEGAFLDSQRRVEGERPARKIYTLTEQGWQAYREAVRARLTSPRPRTEDFDLGLANMLVLEHAEVVQALRSYQSGLQEKLVQVKGKYESDGGAQLAVPARELFQHAIALMSAELEWIAGLIERLAE